MMMKQSLPQSLLSSEGEPDGKMMYEMCKGGPQFDTEIDWVCNGRKEKP